MTRTAGERTDGVPEALLFVGGLHRSGTTAVARLLGHHPAVSSLQGTGVPMDEGQHLQACFPTAAALGGPGAFAFHPDAHLTERDPRATPETRAALVAAWTPFWKTAPWYVEKSPPNLLRYRLLARLFPRALFLTVERHPAAVALATQKWRSDLSLDALFEHWFTAYERCDADVLRLGRPHLTLRYDALISRPVHVLRELEEFLEVGAFPDNAARILVDADAGYRRVWNQCARSAGARGVIDRWSAKALARGWDLQW